MHTIHKKSINGKICGLQPFLFTWGLVVNLRVVGDGEFYDHRYCFEHFEDALESLNAWDGNGLAPGQWIKLKGVVDGRGTDMLNPNIGKT